MTIQEAVKFSREQLETIYEAGEAEAITDWLIEHQTGHKRFGRNSHLSKIMDQKDINLLKERIARLLTHEPVQYVLNEAWFCGLKFYVDQSVLIPRPETEELVEWIISDCKFPLGSMRILDVGTGSGCIAISLKKRLGRSEVWACDKSQPALEVARKNAEILGLNVNFLEKDFLDHQELGGLPGFNIIVSNPPYIPENDRSTMGKNVVDYEPESALFVPDQDALIFYRAIAEAGKTKLYPQGFIYVEIHESLGQEVLNCFKNAGYQAELKKDMQGKDRMVRAVRI